MICAATTEVEPRGPLNWLLCSACLLDAAQKTGFTPRAQTPSWHREAGDGSYARIIAPRSQREWLDALTEDLKTRWETELKPVLGKDMSVTAILAVARVDADATDRNGRNLHTSHETAAERARAHMPEGKKPNAKKIRRALVRLGWLTVITHGGRLTRNERAHAYQTHGGYQTRVANECALTYPSREIASWAAGLNFARFAPKKTPKRRRRYGRRAPLPRRGLVSSSSSTHKVVTNARASAHEDEISPSTSCETATRPAQPTLKGWKALSRILSTHAWLDNGQHLGILAQVMSNLTARGWSATDVLQAMQTENETHNRPSLRPGEQHNPRGLFLTALARCCTGTGPTGRAAARKAAQAAKDAAAREEEKQHDAQCVPPTPFFQQMRVSLKQKDRSKRLMQQGSKAARTPKLTLSQLHNHQR